MTIYHAPVRDIHFLLDDVLKIDRFNNLPGFADASQDVRSVILSEAARFSEEILHPLNAVGDIEGCTRNADSSVSVPRGFAKAFSQLGEGGWIGLSAPVEYGGQGLPATLSFAVNEIFSSANMALEMFSSLTRGAVEALLTHGSDEQKRTYIPNMLAGKWTGTMNLTEPHSGTDLGMMRTKAVKAQDGSYRITGTKIFISCGEHDIAENIIHLVLARTEGAAAGIKGVSLFVVPKLLINDDGSVGERNAVSCGSIEQKMGIHGNPTCVLNYEGATGWLVGGENKGMEAMFVMMNEARLGAGLQGMAQSEVAYQNAANYAKERLQGRAIGGAAHPEKPADPIIVHPDVRRNLQSIRAFNEAARALALYSALRSDLAHRSEHAETRSSADEYLSLVTPVIKGVLTDKGFANAVAAQQMYGGHGYIVETGAEQFVRDARITMLYEGANGIQALDLVARKLPRNNGRAVQAFLGEIDQFIADNGSQQNLTLTVKALNEGIADLKKATGSLMKFTTKDPNEAIAGSTDYMHLLGLVALGYMWGLMLKTAYEKIADGDSSDYLTMKISTGSFFLERALPETALHLRRIEAGGRNILDVPAEAF